MSFLLSISMISNFSGSILNLASTWFDILCVLCVFVGNLLGLFAVRAIALWDHQHRLGLDQLIHLSFNPGHPGIWSNWKDTLVEELIVYFHFDPQNNITEHLSSRGPSHQLKRRSGSPSGSEIKEWKNSPCTWEKIPMYLRGGNTLMHWVLAALGRYNFHFVKRFWQLCFFLVVHK